MMTDDELRVSIAEKCGWVRTATKERGKLGYLNMPGEGTVTLWKDGMLGGTLPDYLTDLNAMHEAEKVLTLGQNYEFGWELSKVLGFDEDQLHDIDNLGYRFAECARATARQRAEAFARVCWPERFNR